MTPPVNGLEVPAHALVSGAVVAGPPPWKRKSPPGQSHPLSTQQVEAERMRAAQAGRRYPNRVDNILAAPHVPRGDAGTVASEEE